MQTNNSKTQNQFPTLGRADENLTFPFNVEEISSLTPDRIKQLNYLAYDAEVRYGAITGDKVDECNMMCECFGLIEALEMATDFDSHRYFHQNIYMAFKQLMKERPDDRESIFTTYTDLTDLFRVLLKQKDILEKKLSECNDIVRDVNTLEVEGIERRKGGAKC